MLGRKTCPRCSERVKSAARVCRFCRHEFVTLPITAPPDHTLRYLSLTGAVAVTVVAILFATKFGPWMEATPRLPPPAKQATTMASLDSAAESLPQYPVLALASTFEWTAEDSPDEVMRQAGPFVIRITKKAGEDSTLIAPVVDVSSQGQSLRLEGNASSLSFGHKISLIQNMRGAAPVLMFQSFSGGAHCCNSIQLAGFSSGKLRAVDLGSWDGDYVKPPVDLNGDGLADFVFSDDAFLYAFASYASSFAPPKILNVRGGKVVDISRNGGFSNLFAQSRTKAREQCLSGSSGDTRNGACPAYVASAARVGNLDSAWREMVGAYDASYEWDLPMGCDVRSRGPCPRGHEIQFKSYPEALLHFLKSLGYISQRWVPPEFRERPPDEVVDEDALKEI